MGQIFVVVSEYPNFKNENYCKGKYDMVKGNGLFITRPSMFLCDINGLLIFLTVSKYLTSFMDNIIRH